MRAMYKIAFVFAFLISYIFVNAQNVSIRNGRFKVGADDFYPMVMNYQAFLVGFNGDYFVSPHPQYGSNTLPFIDKFECNDEVSCSAQMQEDFNYISSLGFNTIRVGATPDYVPGVGMKFSFANFNTYPWPLDVFSIDPTNSLDPGMQKVFTYFDKILECAAAADLKVIFITVGSGLTMDQGSLQYWHEYLKTLAVHCSTSVNKDALFAYDLYNEPCANFDFDVRTPPPNGLGKIPMSKQTACEYFGEFYDVLKTNDPEHFVTIGSCGSNDVFVMDPSVLKLDFLSLHVYPDYKPWEDRTWPSVQEHAKQRIANELLWLDRVATIPWIIGETGFAATDDLLIPRQLIHGDLQQLGDYSSFILDATCNCGGKGFSWWMYQEVDWGSGPSLVENYLGLLKYGTTPSSSPSPLKQPAANNFSSYVRGRNAPCPSDHTSQYLSTQYYYNPYQYPTTTQQLSSKIVDQNNLPIEYGKMLTNSVSVNPFLPGSNPDSDISYTFSDINGDFKINQTDHPPTPGFFWQFAQVIFSGPGAERRVEGWFPGLSIANQYLLKQLDVNNEYVSDVIASGISIDQSAKGILKVSDIKVEAGGEVNLKASKSVEVNEFNAERGSEAFIHIDNVLTNCNDFNGFQIWQRKSSSKNDSINSEINIELKFKTGYNFTIYPNPADKFIHLESNLTVADFFDIEILSILGLSKKYLYNVNLPITLDLSELSKGVYFLKLSNEHYSKTEKIILN